MSAAGEMACGARSVVGIQIWALQRDHRCGEMACGARSVVGTQRTIYTQAEGISGEMACGARSVVGRVVDHLVHLYPLPRRNGLWSPFGGRKYSRSRIGEEAVVFVEGPADPVILGVSMPFRGLKGVKSRRLGRYS